MHQEATNYCKYDNQVLILFTSSLYFSALVMTFFACYLTRKKGRKTSIIVGALSFLAGAILNAAAQNIAMLIKGYCNIMCSCIEYCSNQEAKGSQNDTCLSAFLSCQVTSKECHY
ncbi:hypothetical protein AAHE18_14G165500 [Arachis hypogaea]